MEFLISASSDIGIKKDTNQDSVMVKSFSTPSGKMAFAVLCDGMGGLAKGELASTDTIKAFENWFRFQFPYLLRDGINESDIRKQWNSIVTLQSKKIMDYAYGLNLNMGTTIVAGLFTQDRYFIMNVGDSRGYLISDDIHIITKDHTVVSKEVEDGVITEEQARTDPRRNVLLQCIGASEDIYPGYYFGHIEPGEVFMFCSDGFVHELSTEEMYSALNPSVLSDKNTMKVNTEFLIDIAKERKEKDNISVILVKTC